ncbi:type II toxin-antitoxin system Phd/YefM family antitoxin [Synechococcus sp. L2F]|uniref:type II toxin-antitoxin system Phd/YefM family antitoxin n=1 Tax=Synechococcus sp. L2F TaxID=2823739 RepID=UPI0028F41E6A|nr:type II toxin-antitoxin system Phd/YefM family antitoxin [Synechococcus sp. L2F]
MASLSATESRKRLNALNDEVTSSHEPVQITGKRGNAVLLSESDWQPVQETLHLVSISGMRESILEGLAVSAEELSDQPGWSVRFTRQAQKDAHKLAAASPGP